MPAKITGSEWRPRCALSSMAMIRLACERRAPVSGAIALRPIPLDCPLGYPAALHRS